MNFCLVNQFFAPDPAPTGQLLADVARGLAAAGHAVTVICAGTAYTKGEAGECAIPGVSVHRIPCTRFGHGHAARLASYASFQAGVLGRLLLGPRPDFLLTLTTPPLLSLGGTIVKHLRGVRHVIWEMDLYPDVAVALGVFASGSWLDRAIGALADLSRRHADAVIALGPCMRARLLHRGIAPEKVRVAENWIDGALIAPQPFPEGPALTVLYSGNLGLAHDIETVLGAMRRLNDSESFRFVFAGGGARRAELESACRDHQVTNAAFLPYVPQAGLAAHLGGCHAGLVTQNPATCGTVVPSKTYAFLAAGRPVIFVGPRDATPARLIERFGCGWQIDPGDPAALVELLRLLAYQPEIARAAGRRARNAFLRSYDRTAGVARILAAFTAGVPDVAPAASLAPTSNPASSL